MRAICVECNWKVGFSLEIPKDWLSGVYLGKLSTLPAATGQFLDLEMRSESYFIFIVRDDRKADLLFQASDMTWLSYNRWPQWRSLYDLGAAPWGANQRTRWATTSDSIGPTRLFWNGFPAGFHPLTNGSGEFLMTEFPLAFWLEKEGYDVTYISNVDTHADGHWPPARQGVPVGRPRRGTGPSACSRTSPRRAMPASASHSSRATRSPASSSCCRAATAGPIA